MHSDRSNHPSPTAPRTSRTPNRRRRFPAAAAILALVLAAAPAAAQTWFPWDEQNICDWSFGVGLGASLVNERFQPDPPNHKNGTLTTTYPWAPNQPITQPAELFLLGPNLWELVVEPRGVDIHCYWTAGSYDSYYDCHQSNGAIQVCVRLGPELSCADDFYGCGCEVWPFNRNGFTQAGCYRRCAEDRAGCAQRPGYTFALSCLIAKSHCS